MIDPPDEMPPDLAKSGEIEERLLGGPRRHTRTEAAAFADVSPEYAQRLWRALGFANVGEGAAAFTDGDLIALDRLMALVRSDFLDEELAVSVTRALGHNVARLVEWQVEALGEHLEHTRALAPAEALRAAVDLSSDHLEEFEALLVYAWRRQLAAVAGRALAERDAEAVSGVLSVGFADLVSFTRLSQRLEERELAALVDRFGRRSADVIAGAGGRLVKTVGDEVLFVADSAARAARIGLELAETMAEDPVLPDVRVGIATGTVLTRMGDVFGRTVNLANRLTALAAPGTVLADRDTTEALASDPDFVLDVARTRAVRGMGLVRPGVVRRRR
ncbi:MAG: adenylate/guanylate cyclase domain-containing protein [Sporichthyaceae bacterium]|nr:adenylate/guanylate cyclase domain-containing protein [Sporichthyaceae bacterium]